MHNLVGVEPVWKDHCNIYHRIAAVLSALWPQLHIQGTPCRVYLSWLSIGSCMTQTLPRQAQPLRVLGRRPNDAGSTILYLCSGSGMTKSASVALAMCPLRSTCCLQLVAYEQVATSRGHLHRVQWDGSNQAGKISEVACLLSTVYGNQSSSAQHNVSTSLAEDGTSVSFGDFSLDHLSGETSFGCLA